ncbi:hypothetical protein LXL04_002294 [Taraxacum kok-saghyz]
MERNNSVKLSSELIAGNIHEKTDRAETDLGAAVRIEIEARRWRNRNSPVCRGLGCKVGEASSGLLTWTPENAEGRRVKLKKRW